MARLGSNAIISRVCNLTGGRIIGPRSNTTGAKVLLRETHSSNYNHSHNRILNGRKATLAMGTKEVKVAPEYSYNKFEIPEIIRKVMRAYEDFTAS